MALGGTAIGPNQPVAVITGAASGIGAATAVEFASLGFRVIVCDLPGTDLASVSLAVETAGGAARAHPADIRDFASLERLARMVADDYGPVDVLVANAGIEEQSSIATGDPAEWGDVLDTNLRGTIQTVRAFLPEMIEHDRGDVVITGSVSGRGTAVGNPVYSTSKWGLVGFTRALRGELDARLSHVRVTLVDPGLVDTPLSRSIPGLRKRLDGGCALMPEDIARLVSFVIRQPRHVLLSELRIEPVVRNVPATFARKAGNRMIGLLES